MARLACYPSVESVLPREMMAVLILGFGRDDRAGGLGWPMFTQ